MINPVGLQRNLEDVDLVAGIGVVGSIDKARRQWVCVSLREGVVGLDLFRGYIDVEKVIAPV